MLHIFIDETAKQLIKKFIVSQYEFKINLTDPMALRTPPDSAFLHGTPPPAVSDFGQFSFLEQENASSSPLISSNNPILK